MALQTIPASPSLPCQKPAEMAEKKHTSEKGGREIFRDDLAHSPEWASLTIGRRSALLYLVTIFIGIGLCLGTLSVLLS